MPVPYLHVPYLHATRKNFQLDLFSPDDGHFEYSAVTTNKALSPAAVVRKNSRRLRRDLLQAVFVMETTEDRSRHDPRVAGQPMAGDRGRGQPRRWFREA